MINYLLSILGFNNHHISGRARALPFYDPPRDWSSRSHTAALPNTVSVAMHLKCLLAVAESSLETSEIISR